MLQIHAFRFVVLFVLSGIFVSSIACQEKERRPNRYLIPDGYVGWVRINYKVKGSPAISIEDGYYLFKFPESGLLNTSSSVEKGWAMDEYYYYFDGSWRKLPHTIDNEMIWGSVTGTKRDLRQEPTYYEEFFVGTEEEYNKYGVGNKDSALNPIIGPIDKRSYKTGETMSPNNNRY